MTSAYSLLLRSALLALLLTAPALSSHAKLEPTREMRDQTRWVVNTINNRHYLRESIDALDGREIVEAYIESFDYSRMYFIQPEIDTFSFRFSASMEDFLEKGNLYAAFEIYTAYTKKAQARTDWVYQRLEQPFDFTLEETFTPDRREAAWPGSASAANQLWERRLKYELLNELLSLAAESDPDTASNGVKNPDLITGDDEAEFDPAKLQRLLDDPDFNAQKLTEAKKTIRRRYERNLNYALDREAAEVQEAYINAMTQLFDPHSTFLSADTLESFNSTVQNSFVGIGAMLQDDDGICVIKEILPGGPAEASGKLHPEDKILAVAQGRSGEFEDVVDMQLRYIVRKIKGKKGTVVRLLIRPGDALDPSARKEVLIVRNEVKLTANLATAKLITVPGEAKQTVAVGVIELPSFYGNIGAGDTLTTTSEDITELLGKLREAGAEGIVLDLRMNGGGLLTEAVRVAGLFIPTGPVVQVRDKDGRIDVIPDRDPRVAWEGPLIVLTSRFSASASEIVAGALQDHGRALIIGNSSTHGKGTVQEVYHMANRPLFSFFPQSAPATRPVATKITIKQFYLPGGSSTQVKGVPSDIILPSVNEFLPIGESDLDHALPWDYIPATQLGASWNRTRISGASHSELRRSLEQASLTRQATLEEFDFLQRQIDWRQQRYDEKAVSLHLKRRITQKIHEQHYLEELDAAYEALSEQNYQMEAFVTQISAEQEALSQKNQAQAELADAGSAERAATADDPEGEAADDTPPFDIYLRESARIMADWIAFNSGTSTAPTPAIAAAIE